MAKQIEDIFLDKIREEGIVVYVYLANGIKLQGVIQEFDKTTISFGNQIVYKHAIASVVPVTGNR